MTSTLTQEVTCDYHTTYQPQSAAIVRADALIHPCEHRLHAPVSELFMLAHGHYLYYYLYHYYYRFTITITIALLSLLLLLISLLLRSITYYYSSINSPAMDGVAQLTPTPELPRRLVLHRCDTGGLPPSPHFFRYERCLSPHSSPELRFHG